MSEELKVEEDKVYELTEKKKKEYKKLCDDVTAIHKYIGELRPPWMDNAERFIALNALHTHNLMRHSSNLTRLTCVLAGLTLANIIFLIIDKTCI